MFLPTSPEEYGGVRLYHLGSAPSSVTQYSVSVRQRRRSDAHQPSITEASTNPNSEPQSRRTSESLPLLFVIVKLLPARKILSETQESSPSALVPKTSGHFPPHLQKAAETGTAKAHTDSKLETPRPPVATLDRITEQPTLPTRSHAPDRRVST